WIVKDHSRTVNWVCTQTFFRDQQTGTGKQSHLEEIAPFKSGGDQFAAVVSRDLPILFLSFIPFGDVRHLELLLLRLAGKARTRRASHVIDVTEPLRQALNAAKNRALLICRRSTLLVSVVPASEI